MTHDASGGESCLKSLCAGWIPKSNVKYGESPKKQVNHSTRLQGTPIPTNDIWITAQTMEHGAELVTTDSHFDKISGLVYARF